MTRTDYAKAYKKGFTKTVRFLCSRGISADVAEESAQDAWAKGWEKRDGLQRRERVVPWVNTIALNIFRGRCRKQSREEELPEQDVPVQPRDPSVRVDLEKSSRACPGKDWKLLYARYASGVSAKELAAKLGLKPVTVRVRLLRAKARLRHELSEAGA